MQGITTFPQRPPTYIISEINVFFSLNTDQQSRQWLTCLVGDNMSYWWLTCLVVANMPCGG
uniref:Uncharacterized protein n=1 Tax=Arion vulgaris TaxID=1028688 RepID=A0A0B6Y8X7_9EUPU